MIALLYTAAVGLLLGHAFTIRWQEWQRKRAERDVWRQYEELQRQMEERCDRERILIDYRASLPGQRQPVQLRRVK